MRWIKHQTDSIDSPFIQELLTEFGPQGYLAYYGILEIVAKAVGYNPLQKVNFSSTFLKQKLHISSGKLREIFDFCSGKGELIFNFSKENFEFEIPKLAVLKDNYSKDLQGAGKKLAHHIEVEVEVEVEVEADIEKEKNKTITSELGKKPTLKVIPWPEEEKDFETFIKTQKYIHPILDYEWWDAVSVAINGISVPFVESEFAKMSAWIKENPRRAPTQKGVKRFVRVWLEKSAEDRRRKSAKG